MVPYKYSSKELYNFLLQHIDEVENLYVKQIRDPSSDMSIDKAEEKMVILYQILYHFQILSGNLANPHKIFDFGDFLMNNQYQFVPMNENTKSKYIKVLSLAKPRNKISYFQTAKNKQVIITVYKNERRGLLFDCAIENSKFSKDTDITYSGIPVPMTDIEAVALLGILGDYSVKIKDELPSTD